MRPGQEEFLGECQESVLQACKNPNNPFSDVIHILVKNERDGLSHSGARNIGIGKGLELRLEWLCFLDVEDLLLPNAFEEVGRYVDRYDGIWGQIFTFKNSNGTARKVPHQLESTDDIRDILLMPPWSTLASGQFIKRKVAIRNPFNESIAGGQEFSQFLEVWAKHECVKIARPLCAKRIGASGDGGKNWQQREDTKSSEGAVQNFKRVNARTGSNVGRRVLEESRMDVAVFGVMRSGTTLLADLLTVPGESIILHEPALLYRGMVGNSGMSWEFRKTMRQLREFGLDVSQSRCWDRNRYPTFRQFFNKEIYPALSRLRMWGAKIVEFDDWQGILAAFQPVKLILSVRDIRDAVLSLFDLALRMNRNVVDERWIEEKVWQSACQLVEMAKLPHLLVKYEELCGNNGLCEKIRSFSGVKRISQDRPSWETVVPFRHYELEKHGKNISSRSVNRHRSEPFGPVDAIAKRIWGMCESYCDRFGYERPEKAVNNLPESSRTTGECHRTDETVYSPALGRRKARQIAVSYIRPGSSVLDLSCGTMSLEPMLPPECRYIPCDVTKRDKRIVLCDFNRTGTIPRIEGTTHIVCIGLLEYIHDISRFLRTLRDFHLPVVLAYHPRELNPTAFASFGWLNCLTFSELSSLLNANGFNIPGCQNAGDYQLLLSLLPS